MPSRQARSQEGAAACAWMAAMASTDPPTESRYFFMTPPVLCPAILPQAPHSRHGRGVIAGAGAAGLERGRGARGGRFERLPVFGGQAPVCHRQIHGGAKLLDEARAVAVQGPEALDRVRLAHSGERA